MAKMRITYHNGRANKQGIYSSKHNDRNFDIKTAEHIEPSKAEKNIYWHCYQQEKPELTFEEVERKYYTEHFSRYLASRNEKSIKQGHKERVQSIEDYQKSKKSCPEETLFQVGNKLNSVSREKLNLIIVEYLCWKDENYPNCVTLDVAYHADEQGAGHIHERHIWLAHDREGREMVNQGKALQEMCVPLPDPTKKEGRYNNAKMTFTQQSREKIAEIARKWGIEIEDKPLEASESGKDLLQWQIEQDQKKVNEAETKYQDTLAEIAKAEIYLAGVNAEVEAEKNRKVENKAMADAEAKRLVDLRNADAERQRQFEVGLQSLKEKAEKEKKRAGEIKALAEAENKRLADLRIADAERQRQYTETQKRFEDEKKKLKNFKAVADKRMDEIMDELEATIKEVEEITKKKVKVAAEYNQLEMNRDFLMEKNEGLLENQRQILEDNKKYDAELNEKYEEVKQAEQIISEAENARRELKLLQIQIPARKRELTEIKANKEESVQIIAKIAEPILSVSSAIDSQNQNKVWSAIKNLVKAFSAIVDDLPILRLLRDNQYLIKNENFTEAYENSCEVEQDLSPMERGLKFLVSVVRVHGTNAQIVNNAISTVADVEGKDTAFEVQLLNSIRNTDEYKNQQAINNLQNAKKQNGWRD